MAAGRVDIAGDLDLAAGDRGMTAIFAAGEAEFDRVNGDRAAAQARVARHDIAPSACGGKSTRLGSLRFDFRAEI